MSHEPMTNGWVTASVNLSFRYAAGAAASRFLTALRDEQKIYGTRCPDCRRVLVPARSFCPRCFVDTTEWIEVGPLGTLVAIAAVPLSSSPRLPLALIRLDGADTNLLHLLGEAEPPAWQIGLRLEAVFATERRASIRDILYFRPAPTGGSRTNLG